MPEEESTWEYGPQGQVEWTRRPGGRCWPCHQDCEERLEREAEEQLEAARAANAALRPCWRCRGSIGGKEDSLLELREEAGRTGWSARSANRTAPSRTWARWCCRSRPSASWWPCWSPLQTIRGWEDRVLHAKLYPAKDRGV
ncbi:hypothetical protein AB0A71_40230 [Kitasatospora aureofaciens]|uniref:hypothetical protein n=1 Tax=Kitasatospora aureofaciens TaxID=1894 RepID=UPI0033FA4B40